MITRFCQNGWPEKHRLKGEIKKYISVKDELWIKENLLLRGSRIVVPLDLRVDILAKIHSGHQGKTKCLPRARQSVWWPGINKQLEDLVDNCEECCKHRYQPAEPMIPSTLPDYPWQSIATDLFCWNKSTYLLAVDYFSRFIEIAKLSTTTSQDVINHLKSMFARHGIPEVVRSDNGPQYSSESFAQFAQNYGFVHVTSSPKYPQSNGAAERAVRTVKSLLMKNNDPYEALMAYRTTPLENGYSPAELLMGRKVRTTVPITKSNLLPCTINMSQLRVKEQQLKERQRKNFDDHHGAKDLGQLKEGARIWISDTGATGRVIQGTQTNPPRSYMVETPTGTYRRNRRSLTALPPGDPPGDSSIFFDRSSAGDHQEQCTTRLRSGRVTKPPDR